jgi:hypothetical protein
MANFIFNKGLEAIGKGLAIPGTAVIRAFAATTDSAGTPDADDDYVDDLLTSKLTEVSVSGYSRATLGSGVVAEDDTDDEAEVDFADISFGTSVAPGETVKGFIIYVQVGGDDTTPEDDILLAWIDTDSTGAFSARTGGGLVLGGGELKLPIDAEGLFKLTDATT